MTRKRILLAHFLLLAVTPGCGGSQTRPEQPDVNETVTRGGEELPGWTQRQSWTDTEDGRTFAYTVGLDEQLNTLGEQEARDAAAGRAREALTKFLGVAVRSYLARGGVRETTRTASTSQGAATSTAAGESTERIVSAAEEIASQVVHGVEVSFALSERRGVIYALAKVDLDRVLRAFATVESLTPEERERVQSNYDEAQAAMRAAFEEAARAGQ